MTQRAPNDFSDLLLQIYALSHSRDLDDFQEAALALIKPVLPFDTGMWGSGTLHAAGLDVHHLHLHRTSNEMMLAYDEHKEQDTAAFSVTQQRSATVAVHSPAIFSSSPGIRDFTRRFRHNNVFISAETDLGTRYTQWLSLYRANVDAHCQESERQLLQRLRPHLMQALAMNRQLHLGRLAAAAPGMQGGQAIADLRGVVQHADASFNALVRAEWPRWQPGALPPALVQHFLREVPIYKGAATVVRCRLEHQLLFLRARPRCKVDTLTVREHDVALRVARGDGHKTVAQQLGRSPATVRSHLQSVYTKLEVSNVAEMVAVLREAGW
jgi:DNA-binding CsgD family transcriptional regulator